MAGKKPPEDEDEALWSTGTEDDELWAQGTPDAPAEPPRQDWGDAARSGSSVVQPPPGPESIAPKPFGPENIEVDWPEALALAYLSGVGKQGADEATGATAAAMYGGDGTTGDVYRMTRDRMRARMAAAQVQHPYLTFGAGMAGDMTSDYLLSRFLNIPVTSQPYQTAMGGVSGFLGSDADLTRPDAQQVTQAAADTGKGLALGYTAPIVGRWVGKGVGGAARWVGSTAPAKAVMGGLKEWLEKKAAQRALAASGYIQKDLKPIMKRAPEQALESGKALLKEGVIPIGGTVSDIAENLEPAVAKYGQQMEDVLRQADASGSKFDMEPFLARVEQEILQPIRGDPVVAREIAEMDRIVDGYRALSASKGGLSFAEANAMKSRLQKMGINWGNFFSDSSPSENAQQFKVHLQNLFLNSIDEQIDSVTSKEIGDAFRAAKRGYGVMVDALKKAKEGRARLEGNKQLSITDYLAALGGISGAMTTGTATPLAVAAGAAVGNKLMRERGPSTAARAFNALATGDWLDETARTNPEVLGKWGQYLGAAASRSPEALGIAKYELGQTDPEYQEERRRQGGQNP